MSEEPDEQGTFEIFCDESGHTGENLTQGAPVFAEGSHCVGNDESAEMMKWLRRETGTQAPELKWKHVRDAGQDVRDALFGEKLAGRARVYVAEKDYFVVGKVIDLLIVELYYDAGVDLYGQNRARTMALRFYREGQRALGTDSWNELKKSFNSLTRVDTPSQRYKGIQKSTVDEFFKLVEAARWSGTRRAVDETLDLVLKSRAQADDFQAMLNDPDQIPSLDPLVASLAQLVRYWYELDRKPIRVVHDKTSVLTEPVIARLKHGLEHPGEFARIAKPVKVSEIVLEDSTMSAGIQVADLVAGFGEHVAKAALAGNATEADLALIRPMIDSHSLWGNDASAVLLGLDI